MVCLSVMLLCCRLHAYDFVIKDFVIKRGIILVTSCIMVTNRESFSEHLQGVGECQRPGLCRFCLFIDLFLFCFALFFLGES